MNGKKARNLRNIVAQELPNLPKVRYEHTDEHTKWFPVGLNSDGSVRSVPVALTTVRLVGCQRKAYQRAKQLHHVYHGR